jgi:membrane-associated protease RseP (regulator of RpoE activity)
MKRCVAEIVVCSVGLMASVIPFLVYTDPFWGVDGFAEGEPFATTRAPGVTILKIEPGSPAASAGLQKGDRIVAVNGKPAEFATFRTLLAAIESGQRVTLEGRRGEEDLRLDYRGEPRFLEGVLFLDWQFVAAPIFLALLLLHIATQPLEPPPLWRALLAMLGGLAVVTVAVIVEAGSSWPWTWVWQSKAISHAPDSRLHYPVTTAATLAGLALAFLGALGVRALLMRKARETEDLRVGSEPPLR